MLRVLALLALLSLACATVPLDILSGDYTYQAGCDPNSCCCFTSGLTIVNNGDGTITISGACGGEAPESETVTADVTSDLNVLFGSLEFTRHGDELFLINMDYPTCSTTFQCASGACTNAPAVTGGLWSGEYDNPQPATCCGITHISAWQDGMIVSYIATPSANCADTYAQIGQFYLGNMDSESAMFTTPDGSPSDLIRASTQLFVATPECQSLLECTSGDCMVSLAPCDASSAVSSPVSCNSGPQNIWYGFGVPAVASVTVSGLPFPLPSYTKIQVYAQITTSNPSPYLTVILTSATNSNASLWLAVGCQAANLFNGTLFTESAQITSSQYDPNVNGVPAAMLLPGVSFSSLLNYDMNGAWALEVIDSAGESSGYITDFSLDFDLVDHCQTNPCGSDICVDLFDGYDCVTALTTCDPSNCFYGSCQPNAYGAVCVCDPLVGTGPDCDILICLNQTSCVGAIPMNITDFHTTSSSVVFDELPDLTGIAKIQMGTYIVHSFNDDLVITLTAPNGQFIYIANRKGSEYANVFAGTTWDDQAPNVIDYDFMYSAPVPFLGPEEPFSTFAGISPNGMWTLSVSDVEAEDEGVLYGWSLSFDYEDQCVWNNCNANEMCVDGFNTFTCECLAGWTGWNCSNPVTACDPDPCVFGICSISGTGYECACFGDNTGVNCEIPGGYFPLAYDFSIYPNGFISYDVPPTVSMFNVFYFSPVTLRLDVRIQLSISINHPYTGQLVITLAAPDGTTVTVSNRNGGDNTNVFAGTTFEDWATVSVQNANYQDGVTQTSLMPYESFSNFGGLRGDGVWTLTITDQVFGGDGNLNWWALSFDNNDYCTPNPCNTGTCSNVYLSFVCDCSGTGYTGSTCSERIYCQATTISGIKFNKAIAGTDSWGVCPTGTYGNPYVACSITGTFGPVVGSCVTPPANCLAQTYNLIDWPQTPSGQTATEICPSGYTGTLQRACNVLGVWQKIQGTCTRNQCAAVTEGNATWPTTYEADKAYGTCLPGFAGKPYRLCLPAGSFGPILGTACTQCPADTYAYATWPTTLPKTSATGTCLPGYTGSISRICNLSGEWQDLVTGRCYPIWCPATNDGITKFNAVAAGSKIFGTCLGGTTGRPVKTCDINGNPTISGNLCH